MRHGSVLMMLVIMLPVLFILAAYAINVAYIESVQANVQIVTDVAVQAAGRAYIQTEDRNAALAAARDAATRNRVAGQVIPIEMADLDFGISNRSSLGTSYLFNPIAGNAVGNSVRLTTRTLHEQVNPILKPVFPTFGASIAIRPLRVAVSTQSTMDVSLVIDRSGSMAYASNEVTSGMLPPISAPPGWMFGGPVPPNARWLDLVAAVQSFNTYLTDSPQREKLSLSTYASTSSTETFLTHNYNEVNAALNAISTEFHGGSTAIGLGLFEGLGALTDPARSRPFAVRVMVLLTDGHHNTDVPPEDAVAMLQSEGVTLFTITFSDSADQTRMRELAELCGGEHFHAANAVQLLDAFADIARRLPSLMTQ